MNIVQYGGGTNSTAALVGMARRGIPVHLILFADVGAERPETYAYLDRMDAWLESHGMPRITRLRYHTKEGAPQTLEEELLRSRRLPPVAYGCKSCSQKYKIRVQDQYCRELAECRAVWAKGERVNKVIGYDAGEAKRVQKAAAYDARDRYYRRVYPLMEWGWDREACRKAILEEGLPLPGKSSCFFCPSMKREEVLALRREHPDLLARALAIEDNARDTLKRVKGLGRDWSWRDFLEGTDRQTRLKGMEDW